MDGRAERLAENVPAGDLDGCDRGAMDMAAVERDAVEHRPGDALMRRGSSPMTRCSSSRTAASVVRMKPFSVPSPRPLMPASVSTRTNSQFFQPAPTVKVSMPVILMQGQRAARGDEAVGRQPVARLQRRHGAALDVAVGQADPRQRLDDAGLEQGLCDQPGEAATMTWFSAVTRGPTLPAKADGRPRRTASGSARAACRRRCRSSPRSSAASMARSVIKPVETKPTSLPSRSSRALPISNAKPSGSKTTGTLPRSRRM